MKRESIRPIVVRMANEGKTYGQISKALNVSRGTVGGHLNREKHKPVKRSYTDEYSEEQDQTIRNMHAEGRNCREVSQALGLSYDSVRFRGTDLGLVWSKRSGSYGRENLPPRMENEAVLRAHDAAFVARLKEAYASGEFPS